MQIGRIHRSDRWANGHAERPRLRAHAPEGIVRRNDLNETQKQGTSMSQSILESQPKKDTKSATTERARNIAQGSNAGVPDFGKLVTDHRAYFLSGVTRSAEWRESQLGALRSMMKDHAEDFYAALWSDLRRNRIEADLIDVKYMTSEIDHVLAHFRRWMKPVPISTPYQLAPSHGEVRFDPLGGGLIIKKKNYPMMLTLSPLVAAISAR